MARIRMRGAARLLVIAAAGLASGPTPTAQRPADLVVWAVHDGEKVKRDDLRNPNKGRNAIWDGRRVQLVAARNEVVAFQVIVEGGNAGIARLSATLPGLMREGGGGAIAYAAPATDPTIYRDRPIQIFSQHYMEVTQATRATWVFRAGTASEPKDPLGWTPVQLVPENATAGRGGLPLRVEPRRNQGLWFDIYVGRDLAPGRYTGEITIAATVASKAAMAGMRERSNAIAQRRDAQRGGPPDGSSGAQAAAARDRESSVAIERRIPIELDVIDVRLPDENSLPAMVYYQRDQPELYQGRNLDAAYHRFAKRHRVEFVEAYDPERALAAIGRFRGTDFTRAEGYEGPGEGVGNRIVPRTFYGPGATFTARTPSDRPPSGTPPSGGALPGAPPLNRAGTAGASSDSTDAAPARIRHGADASTTSTGAPSDGADADRARIWRAADAWMQFVDTHLPNVLTFLYMPDEPRRDKFPEIRALADTLRANPGPGRRLSTFVTHGYTPELASAIDIWCVVPSHYDLARAASERAAGKQYWFYNGGRPQIGALIIDAPATDPRVVGWAAFKHGADGYFYWHATHWRHNSQKKVGDRNQDVWVNPITFDNRSETKPDQGFINGDGVLVYPGQEVLHPEQDRGIVGPVSTIQMANLRRGLQDHLLLMTARRLGLNAAVDAALRRVVPRVLGDADPTAPVGFSENGNDYEEARRLVFRAIAARKGATTPAAPAERVVKASPATIGRYFNDRLKSAFAAVAEQPRVLQNRVGCPLHLLCFARAIPRAPRSPFE